MTSITHTHGLLDEGDDSSVWAESRSGMTDPEATISSEYGDYLRLTGTLNDAGDEWLKATYDITDISADLYPNYLFRYRTSLASNGLGARLYVVYDDASTEFLLGETTPQFSTTFKTVAGTLVNYSGLDIDKIVYWGDDYPNTVTGGITPYVEFDFILFHKDTFTLPHNGHDLNLYIPPRYGLLGPPGRIGDITQNLGNESARVEVSCDLDVGDWKRSGDYVDGEVFYEIAHKNTTEPWQWLDTGTEQFKVTLENPIFRRIGGDVSTHTLDLLFREYRLSDASSETYVERFGLDL